MRLKVRAARTGRAEPSPAPREGSNRFKRLFTNIHSNPILKKSKIKMKQTKQNKNTTNTANKEVGFRLFEGVKEV